METQGIYQSIVSNLSGDTYLGGNCTTDIDPKCRCSRDRETPLNFKAFITHDHMMMMIGCFILRGGT